MKITITLEGNRQGFHLKQNLDANVEEDAESLGYAVSALFETAKVLSRFTMNTNPKHYKRIFDGINTFTEEKERNKENPFFPFSSTLIVDEKPNETS